MCGWLQRKSFKGVAMSENEEDLLYEQKLDRITEHIEELVLDAMLAALQKIKKRNLLFSSMADNTEDDNGKF
jgi:hypothetical protein